MRRPHWLVFLFIAAIASADAPTLHVSNPYGKITDTQGIVSLRPKLARRWSPIAGRLELSVGDWLRTDKRGANAAELQLPNGRVIVGPGSLLEVTAANAVKLTHGEIEVLPNEAGIQLTMPDKTMLSVRKPSLFRADGKAFLRLKSPPNWLQGFKGSIANESLGSLVAKVDGRDVPLTVGYHKVTVDIRDQIARTTIEESFVNHTRSQLEGIFYFPLPANASIAGFGMWIGDELVNADVVEKQRAREIYETILRERRDPGLLEWTGGNMFKARIFPIFPHSEKRITITYTQVLPLHGNRYRYSYALKSELLQQNPLRELYVDVRIHSKQAIKAISCPSHDARISNGPHAGQVELSAQEYIPESDFEVDIELAPARSEITTLPHQRGEDGYFLLLLNPGGGPVSDARPVLGDGDPLNVLVLADSSASMDPDQRTKQRQFMTALLGSLGDGDQFNIATCDRQCRWLETDLLPVSNANVDRAIRFLDAEPSLGWTNFAKIFTETLSRAPDGTIIVYVGDATAATTDADPIATANTLNRLYQEADKANVSCHAVLTGSSYDAPVAHAMSLMGSGSVRHLKEAEQVPSIAFQLLNELSLPVLRNPQISFSGVQAARVYPETLGNIPTGTQQVILGRYLPGSGPVNGKVTVTGSMAGKSIRYDSPFTLSHGKTGNSFIPRLWARRHLDHLLEQGKSDLVKAEIIALSEEYNIMTPYTSFLVLESDADRERFKVKRRVRMRDGERFFADGRDAATLDLRQQQMQAAGDWRIGLRKRILYQFKDMERSLPIWLSADQNGMAGPQMAGGYGGGFGMGLSSSSSSSSQWRNVLYIDGHVHAGERRRESSKLTLYDRRDELSSLEVDMNEDFKRNSEAARTGADDLALEESEEDLDGISLDEELAVPREARELKKLVAAKESVAYSRKTEAVARQRAVRGIRLNTSLQSLVVGGNSQLNRLAMADKVTSLNYRGHLANWLNSIFPYVADPLTQIPQPKHPWPAEARDALNAILRTSQLRKLQGGVEVVHLQESFSLADGQPTHQAETTLLLSSGSWLSRSHPPGQARMLEWCDDKYRGNTSLTLQLGRKRQATEDDWRNVPVLHSSLVRPMWHQYSHYSARFGTRTDSTVEIILSSQNNNQSEAILVIDTKRNVLLEMTWQQNDKVTSRQRFSDFVELQGSWWPGTLTINNGDGKRTTAHTYRYRELDTDAYKQRWQQAQALMSSAIILNMPLPKVADAKRQLKSNKPTAESHVTMISHWMASQQWDRMWDSMDSFQELAGDHPGFKWIRHLLLQQSRRHEQLRQFSTTLASDIVARESSDSLYLANHVLNHTQSELQTNERLTFLEQLKPVFARQAPHLQALESWYQRHIQLLQQNHPEAALTQLRELVQTYPKSQVLGQSYITLLGRMGELDTAFAWLQEQIDQGEPWNEYQQQQWRNQYVQLLRNHFRFEEMADVLTPWAEEEWTYTAYPSIPAQLLTALLKTDQTDRMHQYLLAWLEEGLTTDLQGTRLAKFQAAVNHCIGQPYNISYHYYYGQQMETRWIPALANVVRFHAPHDKTANFANQIMQHSYFSRLDACRELRAELKPKLLHESATLSPSYIQRLISWLQNHEPAIEVDEWLAVAQTLTDRWESETDPAIRQQLATSAEQLLSQHGKPETLVNFVREQWRQRREQNRIATTAKLIAVLMGSDWRQEWEDEAFSLLQHLIVTNDNENDHTRAVAGLYDVVDSAIADRVAAELEAIENPHDMSRLALRKVHQTARKRAQQALVEALTKHQQSQPDALKPWFAVERLYLQASLKQEREQLWSACWSYVEANPVTEDKPEHLKSLLLSRHLGILDTLAVSSSATKEEQQRLVAYYQKAGASASKDRRQIWQARKLRLLIALDQPEALIQDLNKWVTLENAPREQRIILGNLLAELNRVADAVTQYEAVAKDDELLPNDYRRLADWYLILDRKDAHRQAKLGTWKVERDYEISNRLNQALRPWQRQTGEMPESLDPDTIDMFTALFRKSQYPQNHLWSLQQYYQYTRDFRLLQALADGMIGHSAARVYPFLQGLRNILQEIRDEATADALVAHIDTLASRELSVVNRRALNMLTLLVARKAAEVRNQPGPHIKRATAALEQSFKDEWTDGEPRLMATFLADLGAISPAPLAELQIAKLRILAKLPATDDDRLHIAAALAKALWAHRKKDEAVTTLTWALEQFREASDGILPATARAPFQQLVGYHQSRQHFKRAEAMLLKALDRKPNQTQRIWLLQLLYATYNQCVAANGTMSLGSGAVLYKAAVAQMIEMLSSLHDRNFHYQTVSTLCSLYRTGHNKRFPSVTDDLRRFINGPFLSLTRRQAQNHHQLVGTVADTVHQLLGARDALAFVLTAIETEPVGLRYQYYQDGWQAHGYRLARYRGELKQLDEDLKQRLLNVVCAALRRDLQWQRQQNRIIYYRHNHFWHEQSARFAEVAETVLHERRDATAAIVYIAEYFAHGLDRYPRAIEILLDAYRREILDENGQTRLVHFLHHEKRHAESVPILEKMVQWRPDNVSIRALMMHAYHHSGRQQQLTAFLQTTIEHCKAHKLWHERTLSQLATAALQTTLYEQCVALYDELIPLHQRTQPKRGIGNGTLSNYYVQLAQAWQHLKNTEAAVEAASAAIVSWGNDYSNRKSATHQLVNVLRHSPDLDAYIRKLDQSVAETGLENPIVRKALGTVLVEKRAWQKAQRQLELALLAQANDSETYDLLLKAADGTQNVQAGIAACLRAVSHQRRNIKLYQQLGDRYLKLGQAENAERAYSSIVEMLPNETESHSLLAEIRQKQNRWSAAIAHWQQVSELRRLEPTGHLRLAEALIHERRWRDARAALDKVLGQSWPPRFSNAHYQASQLQRRIPN